MDYVEFIDFYKSLSLQEKQLIQNIQRCIDTNESDIKINELFSKEDDYLTIKEKESVINALIKVFKEKRADWLKWLIVFFIVMIVVAVIVFTIVKLLK